MQVFPRMRNWTETNKQTGVGNALKRHYQNYLWEYEQAHPEDVTMDRCVLCNGERGRTLTHGHRYCGPCLCWSLQGLRGGGIVEAQAPAYQSGAQAGRRIKYSSM